MPNICKDSLIIACVLIGAFNNVRCEKWSYFHDGCQTTYGKIGLLSNLYLSNCAAECNADSKCTVFGYSSSDKRCFLFDETFSTSGSECSPKTVMFYKIGDFSGSSKQVECSNITGYTYVASLNKCIRYKSSKRLSWENAKEDCKNEGSHLIYVETKEVLDYIQSFQEHYDTKYWIGGKQSAVGSKDFEWLSGEIINTSNGGNLWLTGRPAVESTTSNYCLEVKTSGDRESFGFFDRKCDYIHRYFCEKDVIDYGI